MDDVLLPWLLSAKVDEDEEWGLTQQSVRELVDSRPYHGDFVLATLTRLCTELRSLTVSAELTTNEDEQEKPKDKQENWLEDIIMDSALPCIRDSQLPLPRLNKLTMLSVQHDRDPYDFLPDFIEFEDSADPTNMSLFDDPGVDQYMSDTLANALYLPSLTALDMARVGHVGDWTNRFHAKDYFRSWALPTKLHNPVNLKILRIQYSEVQPAEIEVLLRHTPQLEVLSCDIGLQDESMHGCLDGFQEAFHHVQNTLRHLALRIRRGTYRGSLGSLKHLHNLEVLLISLGMIYDADQARLPQLAEVLPANLRELGLGECLMRDDPLWSWEEERLLQHVRTYWQRRSPKLQFICAEMPTIHRSWFYGGETRGVGSQRLFDYMFNGRHNDSVV
ncbi:hypothetical protein CkaCkLH20_11490 [Colletotrichum karsti]|uniref:F-box domain-containing protein n=1 Tax=Colletotrichum karsti TaxID=1095194 RepID=A0A9P6HTY0_9PEZI|nr:uncharacterized protein CkaCkLH20_11490 [Colletotrichum karsti]KAF9871073.1 hypothetical protein CkaCkLH20_11490 [Colletotrichum karsti]